MREPTRFRDDGAAPAELRGLLGSQRLSRPMSKEMRARSAARVDRLVMMPVAAGLLFWMKGIAVAAGLGVMGIAVVAVVHRPPRVRPPSAPSTPHALETPAIPRVPPAAIVPGAEPARVVAASPSAAPANPAPITLVPASTPGDPLAREAAMLERARSVLDHAPAEALSELDAHALAFSRGALAPERELMAVDALRRLGRIAEARRRGEALLATSPGSLYDDRVRAMLAGLPAAR